MEYGSRIYRQSLELGNKRGNQILKWASNLNRHLPKKIQEEPGRYRKLSAIVKRKMHKQASKRTPHTHCGGRPQKREDNKNCGEDVELLKPHILLQGYTMPTLWKAVPRRVKHKAGLRQQCNSKILYPEEFY